MKRYIGWCISVVLMVVLLLSATACLPEPLPGTFVDDLGRTVNIEKVPQRIVSLAPSNTEILYALGLEDKVVGVTEYCNYPEAAKAKPKIGGFTTVDIERVVGLEPDVILAASIHQKTVIPALEKVGLTVLALAPKTLDRVLANISLVGEITGRSQEATRLVMLSQQRIYCQGTPRQVINPDNIKQVYGAEVYVYPHPVNRLPATLIVSGRNRLDNQKLGDRLPTSPPLPF